MTEETTAQPLELTAPEVARILEQARHVREAADMADLAEAARQREEAQLVAKEWDDKARKAIELFIAAPCSGEVSRVGQCQDAYVPRCPLAELPSCPRNIIALDRSRDADEREKRMVRSGVPAKLVSTVRNGMQQTSAVVAVDEFLASDKRILVLAGGVGTGKSVAAAYAIWRTRGYFVHASRLADMSRYDAEDREVIRRTELAPLLVLDDIGSGTDVKGKTEAIIDVLIVRRYDEGFRTLLTTNRSMAEFKKHAGARLVDRIRGLGDFILVGGQSMRNKSGGQ